jgi:hypothetical protein
MIEMKYIRHSKIGFVLWARTNDVFHSDVANAVLNGSERETGNRGEIVSAGFVQLRQSIAGGHLLRCNGQSESLGISSKSEDSDLLYQFLQLKKPPGTT